MKTNTAAGAMALLLAGLAHAGDVYVTRDANGRPIYTDTPQAVPAQKVELHVARVVPAARATPESIPGRAATDPAPVTAPSPPRELSAEERVEQCKLARQQYEALMTTLRVYKVGPNGEHVFLTPEEMSQARVKHHQYIEQFCRGR